MAPPAVQGLAECTLTCIGLWFRIHRNVLTTHSMCVCFLASLQASTPLSLESGNRFKQAMLNSERIVHAIASRTLAVQFSSSWQRTWTLFSVESSTSSSLPAFRCGPMPASQPEFLSSCPTFFGLDRFSCLSLLDERDPVLEPVLEPVLAVSLQCQPRFRLYQVQRASVPCDGLEFRLPPSFNMLDAFMHH